MEIGETACSFKLVLGSVSISPLSGLKALHDILYVLPNVVASFQHMDTVIDDGYGVEDVAAINISWSS